MFSGSRKPEIDSILITPLGLFVLDFKNYHGTITPRSNGAWGGAEDDRRNPLEQIQDNMYSVKDLLKAHDEQFKDIRLETLIVLTNQDAELDWRGSNVNADARMQISLIGEVEVKVRQLATKLKPLNRDVASKVLDALQLVSVPADLFISADWGESKSTIEPGRNFSDSSESSVPQGEKPHTEPLQPATGLNLGHPSNPNLVAKPVISQLDLVISKMIRWEDHQFFREYLQHFEDPQLLKRQPDQELSAAELERLRSAKANFENRQALANEITRAIRNEIDNLTYWSDSLYDIRDLVSYQRATEIVGEYVRLISRESDVSTMHRLVMACRALTHARNGDQYRKLRKKWWDFCRQTLAGPLLKKLDYATIEHGDDSRLISPPAIPVSFKLDEKKITIAQEIFRNGQEPVARLIDRFLLPNAIPWSSRQRAERLIRRVEKYCDSDVMKEIQSQLRIVAETLDRIMARDTGLKAALLRESLTGEKLSLPLRHQR